MSDAALCQACWFLSSPGPYKDTQILQSFWTGAKYGQVGKDNPAVKKPADSVDTVQLNSNNLQNTYFVSNRAYPKATILRNPNHQHKSAGLLFPPLEHP